MICNFEELSFQIFTIDRFYHKKGFFRVQERPYAALSFRVTGTGDFKIGGKSFSVTPGDILFIPAGVPYEVEYSVSESIVANLNGCNYTEAEMLRPQNVAEAQLLFSSLLEDWRERHSVNRAKSSIYGILEKMDRDQHLSSEKTVFADALRYIEAHFCDVSLDVCAVCEACFVSPSSLQRAFLQQFGITPKQYVIRLRMNRALQLLSETDASVREIANACGYADEKYFSRAFKNRYGYPPSQLRSYIVL